MVNQRLTDSFTLAVRRTRTCYRIDDLG